ncbi:hypothetical protein HPP92_026602 [Vanilla planifolia]|uniref:GH18 domain-containing protein n=1 Tax=Vanilla planifolia TaxID=51239 RepID=A0A835PEQ5_VANPL|nr:hypothetical protein HPP92_026602 [Vanilla planifolia]
MKTPNTLSFLFLLLQAILAAGQNSNLFAEYIGALFNGVKFSDVPVNSGVEFHFILAFAIDYTTSTSPPSPTNGDFNIFWDSGNLSPDDVATLKQEHPNVKVALSLGGDSVSGDPAYFNPSSADSWVTNAVSSLTTIIQDYHLDGLDIDYEHFKAEISLFFCVHADSATFSNCIGRLISTLKSNGDVQSHYQALWADYGSAIDYVNFQFYAYDSGTTVTQFLDHFEAQRANYPGGRVLASFASGSDAGGLSPANGFFDACQSLKNKGELAGIFVWCADNSKSNGFEYETQAQNLLASS